MSILTGGPFVLLILVALYDILVSTATYGLPGCAKLISSLPRQSNAACSLTS
jgi:hypothetical protein